MIKTPKGAGHSAKYNNSEEWYKELDDQGIPSYWGPYWALITKDVIPNSRSKNYTEQQTLLKGPYAVPRTLEIATGILMHHAKTGEKLYPEWPITTTPCLEFSKEFNSFFNSRVVVGSFGSSGLSRGNSSFTRDEDRCDGRGLGGVRRL